MQTYWDRLLTRRLTRRRSMAAAGAGVLGASFLAACGSDSSPVSTGTSGQPTGGGGSTGTGSTGANGTGSTSLVTPVTDETSQVIRGGTYKSYTPVEPDQFDPHISGSSVTASQMIFSHLLRIEDGHMKNTDGTIIGDILESWEMSPDNLTITATLTNRAHFSNTPPVNGRQVDHEDIMFSWNRFKELGARRGEFINDVNPEAPIASMETPDANTLIIHLSHPNATILSMLALDSAGTLAIVAKEGADPNLLDFRRNPIGSGPWYADDVVPGAGFYYRRNEGFQQDDRQLPYMDAIDWPNLREYAAAIAQFRAGAIHHYQVQAADVMQTKLDVPDLVMRQGVLTSDHMRTFFGLQETSPFRDDRVRRAWAMTWNRDLFLDVIYNIDDFEAQGMPTQTGWDTALRSDAWEGWWLDPRTDAFGENARNFQQDLEEAARLLEAAGHPDGLNTVLTYPAPGPSAYPPRYFDTLEVVVAMVETSGLFHLERNLVNYSNEWPSYMESRGEFDGVAMRWDTGGGDPAGLLFTRFNPVGGVFVGGDDELARLTSEAVAEFNHDRRREIVHDIQRHEAGTMFYPGLGGASNFELHWPIVRNRGVWVGGTGRGLYATLFLDPSQPPGA